MIRIYADIVQNLHGTYKQTERGRVMGIIISQSQGLVDLPSPTGDGSQGKR